MSSSEAPAKSWAERDLEEELERARSAANTGRGFWAPSLVARRLEQKRAIVRRERLKAAILSRKHPDVDVAIEELLRAVGKLYGCVATAGLFESADRSHEDLRAALAYPLSLVLEGEREAGEQLRQTQPTRDEEPDELPTPPRSGTHRIAPNVVDFTKYRAARGALP